MKLGEALHAVVLANERFVLRRLVVQAALISGCIAGLVWLPGAWWWACLVLLVLLAAGFAQLVFFIVAWNRSPLDRPWRALALGALRKREQVVELHGVDGEVLHLPVPLSMIDGVLEAARGEGTPIVRDEAARRQLDAVSKRTEGLRRMEELLPHLPTPALREEARAVFSLIRSLDPLASIGALDGPLHELEIKLMAEHTAQTDSSLRGPRPVFGDEIASLLRDLRQLLALPPRGERE
ncbi:MAG: hypothetical protein Q8L48_38730 [Archangium sp.]|nr:hypothetical protein [Archangium sp.]